MDTQFLKTLIMVSEAGSMAAAARAQNLTAAAVNQRIRVLESEFNASLFRRAGKTVQPTEACLQLLPHAKQLVRDADALASRIDDDGLSGALNIGAIATLMAGGVPNALVRLRGTAPRLKPQIHPGTSPQLYEMLANGELDVALVIEPPFSLPKSLRSSLLKTEPLMFISASSLEEPMKRALKSQPYIRYDPRSWGGRHARHYLELEKIQPDTFCTMDDLETTAKMVAKNLGISLVPDWRRSEQDYKSLRWLPVGDERYSRNLVCLYPAVSSRQKAIDEFIKHINLVC